MKCSLGNPKIFFCGITKTPLFLRVYSLPWLDFVRSWQHAAIRVMVRVDSTMLGTQHLLVIPSVSPLHLSLLGSVFITRVPQAPLEVAHCEVSQSQSALELRRRLDLWSELKLSRSLAFVTSSQALPGFVWTSFMYMKRKRSYFGIWWYCAC